MGLKMSRMDEHDDRLVFDGKVVQLKTLEQRHKEAFEACAADFSGWATKVAADNISEKFAGHKTEGKKQDAGTFAITSNYTTQKNPSGFSASLQNTILAVAQLGIKPKYDVFHNKIIFEGHPNLEGDFESVCLVIRHRIAYEKRFEPSKETMYDAVARIAHDYRFNPVLDYLDGLKWDSRKRVDTWLSVYCGAEDNPLNRAFGRKFLLAAVRRVKQPGCKFDNILVLEGKQGTLKSTLGRVLAGDENFSDADILESDKREQQELCEGTWIYEIAELSGLRNAEVEKVKAFASRQEDKARAAYARRVSSRRRTCVFLGTTNSDEYLQDQTGNRRFWPVPIIKVDIDAVCQDRDQLWAEAVVAEATGEALYLPEELWPDAEKRQESRLIPDPWADKLWMFREEAGIIEFAKISAGSVQCVPDESGISCWRISSEYILSTILNISPEKQNTAQAKKLKAIMRNFGWQHKDFKFSGKVGKGYTRKRVGSGTVKGQCE
jgi:predicted P-loop ATPase